MSSVQASIDQCDGSRLRSGMEVSGDTGWLWMAIHGPWEIRCLAQELLLPRKDRIP